ncbi:LysM peptidoglycan-binding domain-containing protein [Aureispira sp. CCB-E]|uniref:lytic transglycosylase n=1 Tax=Aureispira sp. CCB-E TaxID=3051121 RepID=UPI002868B69E|nr:LysM peptidoglycan-binding domain-containing protein [Aureispira sp. CCB-E]WMX17219.1 LysM peptidoglycan-binding domain-containing protein [Aureispira sp. CCB-E]
MPFKFYFNVFFFVFCSFLLQAQTDGFAEFEMDQLGIKKYQPNWTIGATDSLFVEISNGQKYLLHTIRAGQTLYSIKKFYGVDLSDIYYSNPNISNTNDLKVGEKLRIPILSKAIKRFQETNFDATAYIPIFYKVRPSETMYRISKVYFRLPTEILMSRNQLLSENISSNQVLHIGWIDKNGIPDSLKNFTGLPGILGEESQKNKYRYEAVFNGKNEKTLQGTACWDKAMELSAKNKLYVMCSYVPKNGIVRIENPMTNRELYAKVVAAKPENSFTQKSIIVLTPTVAHALGGLDARFYVKVHYCQ